MANPSFEQSIQSLEHIVTQLEKGELTLDEALKQFEKGIKIARQCQKTLKDAEKKISALNQTLDTEHDE
jgi:exodeoxyribonuclease VII small subunit